MKEESVMDDGSLVSDASDGVAHESEPAEMPLAPSPSQLAERQIKEESGEFHIQPSEHTPNVFALREEREYADELKRERNEMILSPSDAVEDLGSDGYPVLPVKIERMKRSYTWNYFTKIKDDAVKCKICNTAFRYVGSTGTMLYHLKLKHPSVSCERRVKKHVAATALVSGGARKCDAQRAHKLTALLCSMLTEDMLPVSVIEGAGFRALMDFVEPDYLVPAGQALTSRMEERYEERASALRGRLEKAEQVAFTTDRWTALKTESYVTITCRYIEKWELQTAVLQTENLPERHAAETLHEKLKAVALRWGLAGRVIACVHDTASNSALANAKRVPWDSVNCFAHTLQSAINEGFSGRVGAVVAAAGRLVAHFNHSPAAAKALDGTQKQLQGTRRRLIQSCETRWTSVCDMLERLSEQRWAVTAALSDRSVTEASGAPALALCDEHWQIIEEMLPVLSTLKYATAAVSAENADSISNIYPVCNSLLNTHLKSRDGVESASVVEFKSAVRRSLEKCMKPNDPAVIGKPALVASLLDPRHKHLRFLPPDMQIAAKSKLLDLASALESGGAPAAAGAAAKPAGPAVKEARAATAKSAIVMLLGEDYARTPNENLVEKELDAYFREPCPSLECSPLEWWKVNARHYPRLAKLAKAYLCIPGTSVPAERLFSTGGHDVSRLRTRLAPEHVNMLIFLNKNQQ